MDGSTDVNLCKMGPMLRGLNRRYFPAAVEPAFNIIDRTFV